MIAAALLATLAPLAALPTGSARYRVEIAGEVVGIADLSVRCEAGGCAAAWETALRAPEDAGGAVRARRIEIETDEAGAWRGGILVVAEDGLAREGRGVPGAVPATVAELLLERAATAPREVCLDAFDEETGARGRACARAVAGGVEADVLGTRLAIRLGRAGFPAEVVAPEQGARYVLDRAARVPARAPRLHGTEVPGPATPSGPLRFCGLDADPRPAHADVRGLPPPDADGASCREKTQRWLAGAARRGVRGRTAVGVAWDGAAFVWHAWAEARVGDRWVPVDPSFRQAPARGPRFTVGRWEDGDLAARAEAGRRILACWGKARVERAR